MPLDPNWFETFFDGLALEFWSAAMTPEATREEVELLVEQLRIAPGAEVLDVPCGNGRHSIELAARGMRMTGLDLSAGYIAEARAKAPDIHWVQADMRDLPAGARFDAAFCWGNSFAYFDHDNCCRFLRGVAEALKPGGRFVLETGATSESLLPTLVSSRDLQYGGIDYHSEVRYDPVDGRLDVTYTFSRDEEREVKSIHQWVHSVAEIRRMLGAAGLEPLDAFGTTKGDPFALGQRLILVAERR